MVRADSTFIADFDVVGKGERARIDLKRASIVTPREQWDLKAPAVIHTSPTEVSIDSLVLSSARGEFGILEAYQRALRSAQHLIYLENQFLWSSEIAQILIDK